MYTGQSKFNLCTELHYIGVVLNRIKYSLEEMEDACIESGLHIKANSFIGKIERVKELEVECGLLNKTLASLNSKIFNEVDLVEYYPNLPSLLEDNFNYFYTNLNEAQNITKHFISEYFEEEEHLVGMIDSIKDYDGFVVELVNLAFNECVELYKEGIIVPLLEGLTNEQLSDLENQKDVLSLKFLPVLI